MLLVVFAFSARISVVVVELSETDFSAICSVLLCIPRSVDLSFSSRESLGLIQIHVPC